MEKAIRKRMKTKGKKYQEQRVIADCKAARETVFIRVRGGWEIESVRFMNDRFDGLQENGSRWGTPGQLVEVPVEVQLAENFLG